MSDPSWQRLVGRPAALLLLLTSLAADGPATSRPIVPGFERLASAAKPDPVEAGLVLLGELNCTSCHRAGGGVGEHLATKEAPILDEVGRRVRPSYLRAFLADPHAVKPGTTMPAPFVGWPKAEKDEAVEALTHFLASTGVLPRSRVDRKAVARGETLYHRVGCVACHGPRGEKAGAPGDTAITVPLGDLAAKSSVPSLANFLLDPHKVRPSGRMPGLNLSGQEAGDIAQFLLKDLKGEARPNLAFSYYEGNWEKLPDLDKLKPRSTGKAEGFDLGVARRKNGMALRFEGFVRTDRAGRYTFHLRSDDGSRLLIDGKPVVDNDGIHPAQDQEAAVELARGSHRLAVEFFDGGGEAELEVEIEGPGLARQDVSDYLSLTEESTDKPDARAADPDRLAADPALVAKGRDLFASVGCASCHRLKLGDKAIAARPESRPLAGLAAGRGGCLAGTPGRGVPGYDLSAPQRAALASALGAAPALEARKPTHPETIARGLAVLNCYACHRRGDVGGVDAARNAFFETTQKEMGDEGRLPPHLDGVGAKLNAPTLAQIPAEGAKDRPYMLTKMPRFGASNTGAMAGAFEAVDAIGPAAAVSFEESPKRVKSIGRHIVGSEALGCIKCHTFKDSEAEGIQAIDMTAMTRRLRREWFHRYVVNPPAFRPGTRMPTAWPDGKSILPKVLGGDTDRQVEAVWRFLADGTSAVEPSGLGRSPMPLFVFKEAVIYRNFIEGAGARAIGVGYPEGANLAFDANDLRVALIWQGGFMDASRHWTGRGVGYQPPMGDNVVTLPEGAPFATLSSPTAPWPGGPSRALGYRFRGYRLAADQRPTFLYDFAEARVEDRPDGVAIGKTPGLRRTLTLTSDRPADGLWFRAAVGETIKPLADGWFLVNGEWKVRLGPEAGAVVRTSGGKQELIAPVKFSAGTATIVEQFEW